MAPSPLPIVGVDLGGTNMQIGVVAPDGTIVGRAKAKTKSEEGRDAVLARIRDGVHEACKAAGLKLTDTAGVGIGAPGAVDIDDGILLMAPNLNWRDLPLGKMLETQMGVPVVLDNDVNVAAWGEYVHGAGRGAKCMLAAWIGTGVGGGLVFNGNLFYGAEWTAGEIGHMIFERGAPPAARSLEQNCSRSAIADRIVQLIHTGKPSIVEKLAADAGGEVKSKVLAQAYQQNDAVAVEVIDDAADRLGSALGSMVTLLSLDRIVIGGGLTEAMGELLVSRVRAGVQRWAFPDACKKVQVVATELRDNAGVIGAAEIARHRLAAGGR